MENTMQFQQNAIVVATNGEEVGRISRIVMDPTTKVVTHIAVRMKSLFKKVEKLVPIDRISETTEEQILLSESIEDLEGLPLLEEPQLVLASEASGPSPTPSGSLAGYNMPTHASGYAASSGNKYVKKIIQNIPEGTIAVKEGAKVITSEGKYIGKVERIDADLPEDHATHFLVSKGSHAGEKKLVPIRWVQRLGEEKIFLSVTQDSVQELASASPE